MEEWNVEALAEIPLWREKNEKLEQNLRGFQNPVGFGNLNPIIRQD